MVMAQPVLNVQDGAEICISCNDNFTLDGNTCNLNSGYYIDSTADPPTARQHNTCNGSWVQTPGDATTDAVCGTCTDIKLQIWHQIQHLHVLVMQYSNTYNS